MSIHKSGLTSSSRRDKLGRNVACAGLHRAHAVDHKGQPCDRVVQDRRTKPKELARRLAVIYPVYAHSLVGQDGHTGITYDHHSLSLTLTFADGQISTFKAFPSAGGAGRSSPLIC